MTTTTPTALVSGSDASTLAEKLSARGYEVTAARTMEELTDVAANLPAGSLDLYVQLPVRIAASGDTPVQVVRNFLNDGLLRRFDAASAVIPALSEHAVVALVSGNHPGTSAAPDNPEARISLMKVLGHTMLLQCNDVAVGEEQEAAGGLKVKIISGVSSEENMIETILQPQVRPLRVFADIVDTEPSLDYAGWRDAILTLTETHA